MNITIDAQGLQDLVRAEIITKEEAKNLIFVEYPTLDKNHE